MQFRLLLILSLLVSVSFTLAAPAPESPSKPSSQAESTARRKEGLKQAKEKFMKQAKTKPEKALMEKIWADLEAYDFGAKKGAGLKFLSQLQPHLKAWLGLYPKDPDGRAKVIDIVRGLVFVVGDQEAQGEAQKILKTLNEEAHHLVKQYPKNAKAYLAYGETLLGREGVDDEAVIRVYFDCAKLAKTDPLCRQRYEALRETYERPQCPSRKASTALKLTLAQEKQEGDFNDKLTYGPLQLFKKKSPALDGGDFSAIGWSFNPADGKPVFNFELTPDGTKKLSTVTSENIGKYLLIYVDNDLLMGPKIMEKIADGRLQMGFGDANREEAAHGAQHMLEKVCQKVEQRKLPKELTL